MSRLAISTLGYLVLRGHNALRMVLPEVTRSLHADLDPAALAFGPHTATRTFVGPPLQCLSYWTHGNQPRYRRLRRTAARAAPAALPAAGPSHPSRPDPGSHGPPIAPPHEHRR